MPRKNTATILSRTLASTETLRLADFHSNDAFYTPIEDRFERITRLGRQALKIPIVAITAVNLQTQWFKSVTGWNIDELPLSDSLCEQTVLTDRPIVVSDLSQDHRYFEKRLVKAKPRLRFYAGLPLHDERGIVIGTLCAFDVKPRKLNSAQQDLLRDFAALAQQELLTIALHDAQAALVAKLNVARRQALLDPLTKVWNRRGGLMLLEEGIAQAKSGNTGLAVFAVDVDNFKAVNDDHGHAIGDRALRVIARTILGCIRDGDAVCRCGGDEFFVMLVGASEAEVQLIIDRVHDNLQRTGIRLTNGSLQVTVSIGVSFAQSDSSLSAEGLLVAADKALADDKSKIFRGEIDALLGTDK
jgi:diguanylate cyclase (GGDEF)-like protein